jgi:hypothetical protein
MVVFTEIGIQIFLSNNFVTTIKNHAIFLQTNVVKLITKTKNLQHHQKRGSGSQKLGLKMKSPPFLLLLIYL